MSTTTTTRRPAGIGPGLTGPACPERATLDQGYTRPGPSRMAMCVRCGRVTERRDGDGMPWCGGEPVTT